MLGDVGDPQLIGLVAMKLPVDTVAGGGHAGDVTIARAPRNALKASSSHQHRDRQVADGDALSEDQVCMDTPDALGASRRDVHLPDHVGEPGVADRAGRGCAQTSSVVAGLGDVEHATRELHR